MLLCFRNQKKTELYLTKSHVYVYHGVGFCLFICFLFLPLKELLLIEGVLFNSPWQVRVEKIQICDQKDAK